MRISDWSSDVCSSDLKLQGDTVPLGRDFVSYNMLEPVGVTAHIIPWNFPMFAMMRGVAPALAAGCTAVVKPAETTPVTALMLMDILTQAGDRKSTRLNSSH